MAMLGYAALTQPTQHLAPKGSLVSSRFEYQQAIEANVPLAYSFRLPHDAAFK